MSLFRHIEKMRKTPPSTLEKAISVIEDLISLVDLPEREPCRCNHPPCSSCENTSDEWIIVDEAKDIIVQLKALNLIVPK